MALRWTATATFLMLAHAAFSASSNPKSPRIVVIGAGIGGASACNFLMTLLKENGYNATIDVYEKLHVGGRLSTSELNGHLYEMGGSAIHPKNRYMEQFVKDLGLSKRHVFGIRLGLYDGKQYIITDSDRSLSSFGKPFHRYGNSISNWHHVVDDVLNRFLRVYDIQDDGHAFTSVEKLLEAVDPVLVNMTKTSTRDYLLKSGLLPLFVNEIVTGVIRVASGQTPEVNALVGALSLAGAKAGLWGVRGGNEQVPQLLIKKCGANVILRKVTKVVLNKEDGTFAVESEPAPIAAPSIRNMVPVQLRRRNRTSTDLHRVSYDIVIVATPLVRELSGISFEGFPTKIDDSIDEPTCTECYHQSVTTLVNGQINTRYLEATKKETSLDEILTTTESALFNSLSRVYPVDLDEELNQLSSVWKLSSRRHLTDDEMDTVFVERSASATTHWFAYPHYLGQSSSDDSLGRFVLHPGMFHTSSIDWAASSIEMSAISGRNAALLALYHWMKKSNTVDSFHASRDEL